LKKLRWFYKDLLKGEKIKVKLGLEEANRHCTVLNRDSKGGWRVTEG
jgi:hypothetical protein